MDVSRTEITRKSRNFPSIRHFVRLLYRGITDFDEILCEEWTNLTIFIVNLTQEEKEMINNARFSCFQEFNSRKKRENSGFEENIKRKKTNFSMRELMEMQIKVEENMKEIESLVRKSKEIDGNLDVLEAKISKAARKMSEMQKTRKIESFRE